MPATIAQCKEALEKNAGLVTLAAKALGISHQALSARIKRNPQLQGIRASVEVQMLDIAEGATYTLLQNKDPGTVRWYLEQKGRERGYVGKRVEVSGPDGGAIPVEISSLSADELDQRLAEVERQIAEATKGSVPGGQG